MGWLPLQAKYGSEQRQLGYQMLTAPLCSILYHNPPPPLVAVGVAQCLPVFPGGLLNPG